METKIIETKKYIARDWKEFDNEDDCKNHENEIMPLYIDYSVWMHNDKWEVYNSLVSDWYVFNENDEKLIWNLKYILSEIEVKIRLNTNLVKK